ncbi:hypothetical protein BH23PLA1_BH23PLA1_40710 [soil metagenome]
MADTPGSRLLLIVTGSSLRAEEVDRPLAYYLKKQVEQQLLALGPEAEDLRVMVVSDLRWIHDEVLQQLPTISIGGPGVNMLAHRWLEELPLSLAVDEQYYLQMDPEIEELKASVWGMDNPTTQIAVSAFIQSLLLRFLDRCVTDAPDTIDLDDED